MNKQSKIITGLISVISLIFIIYLISDNFSDRYLSESKYKINKKHLSVENTLPSENEKFHSNFNDNKNSISDKYKSLSSKQIINKLVSKIDNQERNQFEHTLAVNKDENIDEIIGDGIMDLTDDASPQKNPVPKIATEKNKRAAYEALGYLGTQKAVDY